jgi:hypothetical protein
MIIEPIKAGGTLGSLGGGVGSGIGNLGRPVSQPLTSEDLLATAIAQGGAVGEAAKAFMNPKKSFFSTVTEKSLGALDKFVSTLQTGNYAIRGLIDPDLTVREAIEQRATPGKMLIEDADPDATKLERFGVGAMRFAVDTLLDPLTYVTFGASRGVLGLSRGAEAIASTELATKMALKPQTRVFLTEEGQDMAMKLVTAKRDGLRQTFLKDERIKLAAKGMDSEDIASSIKAIDDETSDYMISKTLDAKIDMRDAAQTIANFAGKRPDIMEKWIDKGGIKFFGNTVLSGQRIRSVVPLLPGMTILDRATSPIREYFSTLFSTNYQNGVRLPDGYLAEEQKWKDLVTSTGRQLTKDGYRLKSELNLTGEEWEFITAAVEHGLKPRDPRAADVWNLLHGVKPENGTIREQVWQGVIGVQRLNKTMKTSLQEAGILRVKGYDNYMPHMLVDTPTKEIPIVPTVAKMKSDRAQFAKVSTLVDESGKRIPVRMLEKPDKSGNVKILKIVDGEEIEQTVRFTDISKELPKLEEVFQKRKGEITKAMDEAAQKIIAGTKIVKEGVATKLVDSIGRMLDDIPDLLPADKKLLVEKIVKFVDDADVEKIVKGRLDRFYKNGIKFSGGQSIAKADLDKLALDIVMAKGEATFVASRINKLLDSGANLKHQRRMVPADRVVYDKEVAELVTRMKDEALDIKRKTIDRKLDDVAIKDILKQAVAVTSKSPRGLTKVLDAIIGNKQLVRDMSDELSDIARAFDLEKETLMKASGKFIDEETGEIFNRVRAFTTEARELGVNFENNALILSLTESHKATRLAATKHFVDDIAKKYGVPASQADSKYVAIDKMGLQHENYDLSKWLLDANGEQLRFHPAVAKRITEFTTALGGEGDVSKMFKAYDSLQNYFKAAVTSIFPAFHGRNALSNVFLMFNKIGYEALNPANHVATANLMSMQVKTANLQKGIVKGTATMKEYSELMLTPVFKDRTGYDWSWGELSSLLRNNLVSFHPKNMGMVDQITFGSENVGEAAMKMFPKDKLGKFIHAAKPFNPLDRDNKLFSAGFKIGQTIEDYSRTLTFLSQLKANGDPIQAARITKLALFDYANLTKFEREFMRRIIPFYTFTRKNLELQVNTLLTRPGNIAAQIRGVQTLGEVFGGAPLTPEEMEKLPEWAREGYKLVAGREGSHITLLKTIGTPLEETLSRTGAQANLGIISPLIKAPLEMMSGYSFFHGRDISEVTKADAYRYAPKAIQEFIGYAEVNYTDKDGNPQTYYTSFNPKNMHILNNIQPVGRTFSEIARVERQETSFRAYMAALFGIDTAEYDLDEEALKMENQNKQRLEKLLQQAGIGYTFSRYVPE